MVRRNTISWKYEIGQNISDEYRNIKITDRYTKEYPYKKFGYHAANITKCCRNKIKTAYGYMWEYIN